MDDCWTPESSAIKIDITISTQKGAILASMINDCCIISAHAAAISCLPSSVIAMAGLPPTFLKE